MADLPQSFRVIRVEPEAEGLFTIWFAGSWKCEPGQFIMVWLPGVGEKPFAVSYEEPGRFAITVKRRGAVTSRLENIEAGQWLGVRGPYGRGFQLKPRGALVGGGIGVATLAAIKERFPDMPLLMGARNAAELIYARRFPDMRVFTDDGSAGARGFPTAALPELLRTGGCETVYTCGPEVMMARVFAVCEEHQVECQASLERYMKCGFGVCGACVCDSVLVCKDGPVFSSPALRQLREFGKTALLKDGRRASLSSLSSLSSPASLADHNHGLAKGKK